MAIVKCDIPLFSVLDRSWIEAAYFRDAYRAPLHRSRATVIDLFFGIFGHHPMWMKTLLVVRNHIASFCGLDAPTASEIIHVERKVSYRVGHKIGVWPIFALTDTELVAGRAWPPPRSSRAAGSAPPAAARPARLLRPCCLVSWRTRLMDWIGAERAQGRHFGTSTRNGRVPISAPVTASIATGSRSVPVSASR